MASNGTNDTDLRPNLTIQALDQGCLQELFSRCTTNDLPAIAQTCKAFRDLLAESELVWARRLGADYRMQLDVHNSSLPGSLYPLAKQIYTTPSKDGTLRFQGCLVNGSVDDMNMWYWVDNLFKNDRSYFCSDASSNVDCLGLLLDGEVERNKKHTAANHYMRHRCRYAAALFEHIHHPELANAEEILMNMVEGWSDQQLENFFLSLAENVQNDANNPIGRLLFYDVPEDRIAAEEHRIRSIVAYLKDRLKSLKKDLIILPGTSDGTTSTTSNTDRRQETLFDSTVLPKLQPNYPHRVSTIIYELHLSRAGSLTCPVQTGVIFVGIINRSQLKGLDAKTAAERLHAATKDPICTAFNGLDSMEKLLSAENDGHLTKSARSTIIDQLAGVSIEFKHKEEEATMSVGGGKVPLISWKPLLWFHFNSAEEFDAINEIELDALNEIASEEEEEMEDVEEEQPSSSITVDAAGSHGAHSGAVAEENQEPWSDADVEDMSQGQPLIYPPAATAAAGGDADVEQQDQGQEQADDEIEEEEDAPIVPPFMVDHTVGRNELHIPLKTPIVGNVIMVKLINQENLMDELMDGHMYPNIDMTHVHVIGKKIIMPEGIDLKANS
ncbi:hypothetical protein Ndes2526B_g06845 [Nannochloris sp. 'desiccata']|nr:hypothetical protein KSW81_005053 [Chlorella desiccata (nom. nud.)]KAH7617953.1 hypothetical protein NADE_000155 [Chlorella desiccata (nom. nud.)]